MHGKIVILVLTVIIPPPKCDVQIAPVQLTLLFFSQVAALGAAAMMDSTELHIHKAGLSGMNTDGMRVSEVADVN